VAKKTSAAGAAVKDRLKKEAKKKIIYAVLGWIGVPGILLICLALMITLVLGFGILAGFGASGGKAKAGTLEQCIDTTSGGNVGNSRSGSSGSSNRVEIKEGQLGDPVVPEGMVVTSGFEVREIFGGTQMHAGVDFGAPAGSPVYAVADGEVTHDNEDPPGYGHWIGITHDIDGEKVETLYGHMYADTVTVHVGDKVKAGQKIAEVGNNGGMTTGPHLHLGVYPGGWQLGDANAVDPLPWLKSTESARTGSGGTDHVDNHDKTPSDDHSSSGGDDGATEQEERDAADNTDTATTRTGSLNKPQQANVAAIISAAKESKLDDEDQQRRAAEIATATAGMQSNFLSVNNADDPNKVGIFGIAPFGDTSREQLANPKKASKAFYDKLVDTYKDDDKWMTMDTGDVVAEVYSSLTSVKKDVGAWDDMSKSAVDQLWDSNEAARGASVNTELTQNTGGDPCQPASGGADAGGELAPGTVPEEFVKWINLGAEMCEGVTPAIIAAQIQRESGFQPHEANSSNASGYTQFIPETWNTYGYKVDDNGKPVGEAGGGDPNNVADAVMAQARLNCENVETIQKWQQDGSVSKDEDMTRLMLAAYQGGPGSVLDAGGMPNRSDGNMTQQQYADSIIEASKEFAGGDGDVTSGTSSKGKDSLQGVDTGGGSALGKRILEEASTQEGLPYVWGGGSTSGPTGGGFDCSGLTWYAVYKASKGKVNLDHYTGAQVKNLEGGLGKEIKESQLQPGDLIYEGGSREDPEHVMIYAGTDKDGKRKVFEAQQTGTPLGMFDYRPGHTYFRVKG
jgi:cell wall-associated NlpC family hydrolase